MSCPSNDLQALLEAQQLELQAALGREERLREAGVSGAAALHAAISLLEYGGRMAAPSNKMLAQMIIDYTKALDKLRAALQKGE